MTADDELSPALGIRVGLAGETYRVDYCIRRDHLVLVPERDWLATTVEVARRVERETPKNILWDLTTSRAVFLAQRVRALIPQVSA